MTDDKGKKGYGVLEIGGGAVAGGVTGLTVLGYQITKRIMDIPGADVLKGVDIEKRIEFVLNRGADMEAAKKIGTKEGLIITGIALGTTALVAVGIKALRNAGKEEINPAKTNSTVQKIIVDRANGGQEAGQSMDSTSFVR